jgi:hypothetical protein
MCSCEHTQTKEVRACQHTRTQTYVCECLLCVCVHVCVRASCMCIHGCECVRMCVCSCVRVFFSHRLALTTIQRSFGRQRPHPSTRSPVPPCPPRYRAGHTIPPQSTASPQIFGRHLLRLSLSPSWAFSGGAGEAQPVSSSAAPPRFLLRAAKESGLDAIS